MRRAAALLSFTAFLAFVAPVPASAAVYTASGLRCTKVGTPGNDTLTGTGGRDVICGLGGNDVIYGLGGNDVLDGGSGDDTISGGTGNDTISGGTGNDTIFGGTGNDSLSGNDGVDTISGGTGTDSEYGGAGDDNLYGGAGNDLILGQSGNDDLSGQGGNDSLDGGAGTNWCTPSAADTEKACVYDLAPPTISAASLTASAGSVDVTQADRSIKVRVGIRDDTGVAEVWVNSVDPTTGASGPSGRVYLESGTVRDGVWAGTVIAHRYGLPDHFTFSVEARDRVGRSADTTTGRTLTVLDATPDKEPPIIGSVTLDKTDLDVRTAAGTITITAHITDDASGADPNDTYVYLFSPGAAGAYNQVSSAQLTLVKGTVRDGTWRAVVSVARGSVGGDWNVMLTVHDVLYTGYEQHYYGPDLYRWYADQRGNMPDPYSHLLTNGRIAVVGTSDNVPARLTAVKVDNPSIDTLTADQVVHFYVHAQDAPGEGVTDVGGAIGTDNPSGQDVNLPGMNPVVLYQGTNVDGWWELTMTFPQGTPPGRYPLSQLWVADKGHWRSYAPPSSPILGQSGQLALPAGSVTTTSGATWDGAITVVNNPAGG